MTMQINMKQILNDAGYLCDDTLARQVQAVLAIKPVKGAFLRGAAGTGKTFLPAALEKAGYGKQFFYQCFPGTREEDLLIKILPDSAAPSGVSVYDGVVVEAALHSHSSKTILVLDEWDKTRPSADSFLLNFLQTGRIIFSGRKIQADFENLIVFITMNDEREISEPLLRRLPLIEFKPLPPLVVKKALELSHPNHPLIPSCVLLYEHTLVARLPKPATIQELRQLIDAADCLGENADWNELVFQFITKTRDAHEQLSLVQPSARYRSYEQLPVVDPNNYDSDNYNQDDEQEEHDSSPRMPSLSEIKNIHSSTSCPDETPEVTEHSGGILSLTDESYSAVVSMCEHPTSSPYQLEIAEVGGGIVVLKKPIPLEKSDNCPLWGHDGEVVFESDVVTFKDVRELRNVLITSFTKDEVIGRGQNGEFVFRWTPSSFEVTVQLHEKYSFMDTFSLLIEKVRERKKSIEKSTPSTPSKPYRRNRGFLGDEKVSLTPEIHAIIRVVHKGYQEPRLGNDAVAEVSILLPEDKSRLQYVQSEIRFDESVFDKKLYCYYSTVITVDGRRYIAFTDYRHAPTIAEAAHLARTAGHEEVSKIIRLIRKRNFSIAESEKSLNPIQKGV